MSERVWNVYLSGEIHSDWREQIAAGVEQADLPVRFDTPVCEHADSDNCGVAILGAEDNPFWRDHKGASMNAIRTRTLLADADIVVVRFGEKYRQWNAAFDAGAAYAMGKAIITLHDAAIDHALKEVDAASLAVCRTPAQVVQTLAYVIRGALPGRSSSLAAE